MTEDATDLRPERRPARIVGVRIAEHRPGSVISVRDRDLGWVGEVPRRARREEVVPPVACEVRGCFAHERWVRVGKVTREGAGDIGVVVGEVGADELAVHALEVEVGPTVALVDDQIEVAGVHPQRVVPGLLDLVRSQQRRRGEHRVGLRVALTHDLQPADVPLGRGVVDDVRSVHHLGGVQWRRRIVDVGRDDQPEVVPVEEVGRRVAPHAPVPDAASRCGPLLVLAVPVERAVLVVHRATVRLDAATVGVVPHLAGTNGVVRRHADRLASRSSSNSRVASPQFRIDSAVLGGSYGTVQECDPAPTSSSSV